MTAKEEFYALISQSFTLNEVNVIKSFLDGLEHNLNSKYNNNPKEQERQISSLYYYCCSLFYLSAKDYKNFILNLSNREPTLKYTQDVLASQDAEDNLKISYYYKIFNTVHNFIHNKSIKWINIPNLNKDSLSYAITNAIVPEILVQKGSEERLSYYTAVRDIKKLSSLIREGKKITRISFDLNFKKSECVIEDQTCITSFFNNLVMFSSYRMPVPANIDDEIEQLDSQIKNSVKRITYRICMVLVHYRIMSNTTNSTKYFLKDANGRNISLEQNTMYMVSKLLDALGLKIKERKNEYGSTTNTKSKAEKIKNQLRTGQKGIGDTFDYSDITDIFHGCFTKFKKP